MLNNNLRVYTAGMVLLDAQNTRVFEYFSIYNNVITVDTSGYPLNNISL